LAIDYSDGIIQAASEDNEDLMKYATEKNIPLLGYKEDFADAYENFYNQICPDSEE
jgi:starch synthase